MRRPSEAAAAPADRVLLKIEFRGLKKLVGDLEVARKQAFPYAQRDAVNSAAFEARRIWGDEIRKTFTTRNTFTAGRALQVEKAKGLSRVEARVGSTAEYMGRQESGGTVSGRSGHRAIPGPTAAGQAAGGKRTRPVRMTNRLRAIKAAKSARGASRKQRNAAALAIAKRRGQKFAVLERPKGGKGIFQVGGSARKPKARLVWDVSRRSARVPPHPTLGPALVRLRPKLVGMYEEALVKQLKRHRALGY
jgi:hypothetical protein